MFRSIQSALSYFRFMEKPQRATLKDLERLGPSVDFRDLDLAGNPQVNDTFCARLSDYRSLVRLGLSKTPISDDSVRKLAWMGRLESLDLSQTNVSDAIFTMLAGASSLKELNVTGTKCTAQGLADFREVRQSEHPMLGEVRVTLVEGAEVPVKAQAVAGSPTPNPFKPEVTSAEGDAALNAFLSTIDQTPSARKPGSRES